VRFSLRLSLDSATAAQAENYAQVPKLLEVAAADWISRGAGHGRFQQQSDGEAYRKSTA
jgi:hypothetical protein